MVGTKISGYRVERIVSARAGLHATVEASAPRGGRVALKVLDNPNGDDGDWRERVTGLARLRGSIDHPNLLPLIRVGDFGPVLLKAAAVIVLVLLVRRVGQRFPTVAAPAAWLAIGLGVVGLGSNVLFGILA